MVLPQQFERRVVQLLFQRRVLGGGCSWPLQGDLRGGEAGCKVADVSQFECHYKSKTVLHFFKWSDPAVHTKTNINSWVEPELDYR